MHFTFAFVALFVIGALAHELQKTYPADYLRDNFAPALYWRIGEESLQFKAAEAGDYAICDLVPDEDHWECRRPFHVESEQTIQIGSLIPGAHSLTVIGVLESEPHSSVRTVPHVLQYNDLLSYSLAYHNMLWLIFGASVIAICFVFGFGLRHVKKNRSGRVRVGTVR